MNKPLKLSHTFRKGKIVKKKTKLIASIIVSGKLGSSLGIASADGLGKMGGDSSLSLDQVGYPITILTPPINSEAILNSEDQGGKVQSTPSGTIFTTSVTNAVDSAKQPRIDFIVNNISINENPTAIFLAYSTVIGTASQWQDLQIDNILLDRDTFKIISATQVQSTNSGFGEFSSTPTPLGTMSNNVGSSVIMSLNLGDLNHSDFMGDNIYFQVVSIPVINGDLHFPGAKVSELDHYQISRQDASLEGSGSKVSTVSNDVGSKSTGTSSCSGDDSGSKNGGSGSKNGGSGDTGGK